MKNPTEPNPNSSPQLQKVVRRGTAGQFMINGLSTLRRALALCGLHPFKDAHLPFEQRRRRLRVCLTHLVRLHAYSFVMVSIFLPETPDAETQELFLML